MSGNAPIMRLMNIGHQHQGAHEQHGESEMVLSVGYSGKMDQTIEMIMSTGLASIFSANLGTIINAFRGLDIPSQNLSIFQTLGSLTPPLPHIGLIHRKSKGGQAWIPMPA